MDGPDGYVVKRVAQRNPVIGALEVLDTQGWEVFEADISAGRFLLRRARK